MCWIDDLLDFWFGDRGLSDGAEVGSGVTAAHSFGAVSRGRGSGSSPDPISASSLSPLPDIPEMYLRPELIPVEEPDDTPIQADRYIRIRAMLERITGLGP